MKSNDGRKFHFYKKYSKNCPWSSSIIIKWNDEDDEKLPVVVAFHFVVKHFALPSSAGRIRRDIKEMSFKEMA